MINEGTTYRVHLKYDGESFEVRLDDLLVLETPNASESEPAGIAAIAMTNAEVTLSSLAIIHVNRLSAPVPRQRKLDDLWGRTQLSN